jgi:hypothetical protein
MNRHTYSKAAFVVIGALIAIGTLVAGHIATAYAAGTRPAATEFGMGPRTSAGRLYTATLTSAEPLRTRKMQTLQLSLTGADGQPIDGAQIAVDGGMPQHGHGLPTKPRVTGTLGNGVYVIDGVRFNMGGWWELALSITTASGTDRVIFNLSL